MIKNNIERWIELLNTSDRIGILLFISSSDIYWLDSFDKNDIICQLVANYLYKLGDLENV